METFAFVDLETTSLDERRDDLWEIGLITRDLHVADLGDTEWWWQARPDLTLADPNSMQDGRYYERCRVASLSVDMGGRLWPSSSAPEAQNWINGYTGEPLAEGDYHKNANLRRRREGGDHPAVGAPVRRAGAGQVGPARSCMTSLIWRRSRAASGGATRCLRRRRAGMRCGLGWRQSRLS